jgi:hypothetical protein
VKSSKSLGKRAGRADFLNRIGRSPHHSKGRPAGSPVWKLAALPASWIGPPIDGNIWRALGTISGGEWINAVSADGS